MSGGAQPFFSLVMPVYGVERYIADSVADALVQTDGSFELILVDDGSRDRTWEALKGQAARYHGLRLVRFRRNFGQTAAKMAAVANQGKKK